jgi:Prenyltransferase and squalene oxidase repeat
MKQRSRAGLLLFCAMLAGSVVLAGLQAADNPPKKSDKNAAAAAVKPKPLSEQVKKGLAYLAGQQHEDGGWGQGGGWRTDLSNGGRIEGANVADPSDVANTCVATLTLLRAGNTPTSGPYAKNVANAIEFICGHVEKSDKDSLYVTQVRGTQVQSKIGPFVDTFLAALVMAEVKGKVAAGKNEKRLVAALDKTVAKIEKNQKEDGTFAGNTGWASIFSQGLASKGLNRAAQMGVSVKEQTLARAQSNAVANLDLKTGTFASGGVGGAGLAPTGISGAARPAAGGLGLRTEAAAGAPSDAGVQLYQVANQTSALQEAVNTGKDQEKKARAVLADKNAPEPVKREAEMQIGRIAKANEAQKVAVESVVRQLDDKRFIQGFGSNGGEEFLSYLNIGETLVVKGGEEWTKWDKSITDNLNRIQNQDGSWSGDHCITGRTFCTATALLVLMADRTPVPLAYLVGEEGGA